MMQSKRIDIDKEFWKTVKPLFSNKNPMSEIILTEDGKILLNEAEVAECFNEYFCNIMDSLDINPIFKEVQENLSVEQAVLRAINKCKDHPSNRVINKHVMPNDNAFQFSHVSPTEVMRQIDLLDTTKANSGCIRTKILITTKDTVCPYLPDCMNSPIHDCNFPSELKEAELCPLFRNGDSNHKPNYWQISVLPVTSKIYERVLKDQIYLFFKEKFSRILCGFREGYSTQHALIRLIENWRKCLDASCIVGTILMDLSKAYDCLPHGLLIAKFKAYGFDFNSLCLLYSYLDCRHQRVKIGSLKSTAKRIKNWRPTWISPRSLAS